MQGSIYSFMRFPRVASSKTISVNISTGSSDFPSFNLEIPTAFSAEDIGLLEKLLAFSSDVGSNNRVRYCSHIIFCSFSVLPLKFGCFLLIIYLFIFLVLYYDYRLSEVI